MALYGRHREAKQPEGPGGGGYAGSYSPCFIIARHHFHIQGDSNHQGEFGENGTYGLEG